MIDCYQTVVLNLEKCNSALKYSPFVELSVIFPGIFIFGLFDGGGGGGVGG